MTILTFDEMSNQPVGTLFYARSVGGYSWYGPFLINYAQPGWKILFLGLSGYHEVKCTRRDGERWATAVSERDCLRRHQNKMMFWQGGQVELGILDRSDLKVIRSFLKGEMTEDGILNAADPEEFIPESQEELDRIRPIMMKFMEDPIRNFLTMDKDEL